MMGSPLPSAAPQVYHPEARLQFPLQPQAKAWAREHLDCSRLGVEIVKLDADGEG
jgi:hypothetical protein